MASLKDDFIYVEKTIDAEIELYLHVFTDLYLSRCTCIHAK